MSKVLAVRVAMVLATLSLPLGMLSTWVVAYVGNTERYVSTVAPLADDPVVREAAIRYVERETLGVIRSGDQLGDAVRTLDLSCIGVSSELAGGLADLANAFLGGTVLGDQIVAQIEVLVREAARQAVESEAFAQIWVAANRRAHREILAALEGENAAGGEPAILIALERIGELLGPLLPCPDVITAETLQQVQPSLALVNASDLEQAQLGYQVLTALRWVLPVVLLLSVVVAVGLSTSRRRTGMLLGICFALGMLALQGILLLLKAAVTSQGVDEGVLDAVWAALTQDLSVVMVLVALATSGTALGCWFAERRSVQSRASSL